MFSMQPLKFLILGAAALVTMTSAIPVASPNADTLANSGLPPLSAHEIPSFIAPVATVADDPTAITHALPRAIPEAPGSINARLDTLNRDLNDCLGKIQATVALDQVKGVDADARVGVDLKEILSTVLRLLEEVVVDVTALVGSIGTTVTTTVEGVLAFLQLLETIARLLNTISAILFTVLSTVQGTVNSTGLNDLLTAITVFVGKLLALVASNVGGAAAVLRPVVGIAVAPLSGLGLDGTPITEALKNL